MPLKTASTFALEVLIKHLDLYELKELRVTVDGRDFSGKYVPVDVMNAKLLGPNLQLGPQADLFDGQLDVSASQRPAPTSCQQ